MRRAVLVAALGAALAAPVLEAQQPAASRASRRLPRRVLYGGIGAVIGGAVSGFYISSQDDNVTPGLCSSSACVVTFSVGLGTLVGYMVGREFDQLHALRYRGGAPLRPAAVSIGVQGEPTLLVSRDSLVAVGGPGGVQIFRSADALTPVGTRAAGVRGISALDLAPGGSLALGSQSGFYLFPPRTGPGMLIREGDAAAVAAAAGRVYLATGTRVEVVPVDADTSRGWPGVDVGGRVQALAWDDRRSILWVASDSVLISYRPAGDSLERIGTIAIGTPARRLAVQDTRVAVALGEGGVRLIDATDAAAPRELARWTGTRFVYDVSLFQDRLYAASGVEGVYVIDVGGTAPVVIGLARDLGFAAALSSASGYTYVLDRSSNALRRIESDF
jgi:hypothetical protein